MVAESNDNEKDAIPVPERAHITHMGPQGDAMPENVGENIQIWPQHFEHIQPEEQHEHANHQHPERTTVNEGSGFEVISRENGTPEPTGELSWPNSKHFDKKGQSDGTPTTSLLIPTTTTTTTTAKSAEATNEKKDGGTSSSAEDEHSQQPRGPPGTSDEESQGKKHKI